MKKLFYLFTCILILTSMTEAQWTKVSNNIHFGINRINVLDAKENFCAAVINYQYFQDGKYHYETGLFKTFDNGASWNKITFDSLLAADLSASTDFEIVDSLKYFIANEYGKIFATTDGGKNWEVQFSDSSLTTFMNYIEMFDENNGVAMGDCPYYKTPSDTNKALFLKTTDGGKNWIPMENNQIVFASGNIWRIIDFISPSIGYFVENFNVSLIKGLLKTTDGGNNWSVVNTVGNADVIKFYDVNFGMKISYDDSLNKVISRTLNGGLDWQEMYNKLNGGGNDIEYIKNNPSQIWVTDYKYLYFSSDSGKTWKKQSLVSTGINARDIVFTNDVEGWVQCDKTIYYTSNLGGFLTDIDEDQQNNIPVKFSLFQNYPNPFNPTTIIKYSIPSSTEYYSVLQNVTLKVYDILGREVATLVNERKPAGMYNVKCIMNNVSSGVYFYTLKAGSFTETKKMLLMK